MVRILLLSGTDVSTRPLSPGLWTGGIRSSTGLDRRRSPRILPVALPPPANTPGSTQMLFGEYELSPSLIGLSLLPTPHPEAFQRLSVRPSIPCYRDFSLGMGRSLGFASAATDCAPSSDSLSLRLRASLRLTSPVTATRRFIMQKARGHDSKDAPSACRRTVSGTFSLPC